MYVSKNLKTISLCTDQPMDYHRDPKPWPFGLSNPHSDDQYGQDKHYYTPCKSHYRHDGLLRERRVSVLETSGGMHLVTFYYFWLDIWAGESLHDCIYSSWDGHLCIHSEVTS